MMFNGNSMYCVYMTPCNYCSKFDKWCDKKCNKQIKEKLKEIVPVNEEKMLNPAGE